MNQTWRVRICLPGSIIHVISSIEPIVHMCDGRIADVSMDLVTNVTNTPESGDTIGFIDWCVVVALTWRAMQQPEQPK